uniref:J domain-containing protein n=1 Tax=viral metagenome TaxID=1070528 RepID=A0A6C0KXF2_9ZZZZ|tara:strand:- start:3056 stop:3631 length:576 start_codon:yes stop_codon:yes gene_type:complete
MDYYKILEVSKDASSDLIKKQYKKLALKHHPDRGGDPEMFKKVSEAYQTLSDSEKRNEYDNPNPFSQHMPGGGGAHFRHYTQQPHFVDPNIIFQQFFKNNDFFQQHQNHQTTHINIPRTRNTTTTTFNINTSATPRNMRGNIFQKSVSTQINGNTRIETTTEVKNGMKTRTVKHTNMKTGETVINVNQITG